MKISLSFIKEFIDIDLSLQEIADLLTLAGLEVDAIENETSSFTGVIAAKVVSVKRHPQADKLVLAEVTDGKETFNVVCGAPNCRENLHVAFAKVGAALVDENEKVWKIKKSKIRGEESFGMLCSEKELKLSEETEGILELAKEISLGEDLSSFYADPIFEISLTPNLSRCLCALGIARELSAITKKKVKLPKILFQESKAEKIQDNVKVIVEDPDLCPRYSCRLMKNIKMTTTPDWLKRRLLSCGMRPVNVIVDIMNYVMLETNQPLHAFDFDKIENKTIIVRKNEKPIPFFGLDGEERTLPEEAIVIADDKKALALGGILGGASSAVDQKTQNILLESAYFNPVSIRKACKKLNLSTESSQRFERKSDPNGTLFALDRAVTLIHEICGGELIKGCIDQKKEEFSSLQLECRIDRTNKLLGTQLSLNEISDIFKHLEFHIKRKDENTLLVEIPTFRNDVLREIDLIEEVARIYGYNNIEKKKPLYHSSPSSENLIYHFEQKAKQILMKQQLQEFLTCDLIGPHLTKSLHGFHPSLMIDVLHSKSIEQSILRPTLLASFLEIIRNNNDFSTHNIRGFETSRIHFKKDDQYIEQLMASIIMTGSFLPPHWSSKEKEVDYYDIKGILENMLKELGIEKYQFKISTFPNFHPQRQAQLFIGKAEIGVVGEIHPSTLEYFDIKKRVYFSEVNLELLLEMSRKEIKVKPLSAFPSSERDWTFTLPLKEDVEPILDKINEIKSFKLEKVKVLDLYINPQKTDVKNITLRFIYRDSKKTLSFEEVEKEHNKILNKLREKHLKIDV